MPYVKKTKAAMPARQRLAAILVVALALVDTGCSHPPGPAFGERPLPEAGLSLLYIYRIDKVRSSGSAKLKIDGQKIGKLKQADYLWVEVPPGEHEISLRFGGFPWSLSWSTVHFEARENDVRFMRLEADALLVPRRAGHLADDYEGPRSERYSVNLFSAFVPSATALPEIRQCHQTGRRPD